MFVFIRRINCFTNIPLFLFHSYNLPTGFYLKYGSLHFYWGFELIYRTLYASSRYAFVYNAVTNILNIVIHKNFV